MKPRYVTSVVAADDRRNFRCGACGVSNDFWTEKCPSCGCKEMRPSGTSGARVAAARATATRGTLADAPDPDDVRILTGNPGLDLVLGGRDHPGLRKPSFVLFGGRKGTGKSSVLLPMATTIQARTLYMATEERLSDIKARAKRFGLGPQLHTILAEEAHELADIQAHIARVDPEVVVLDSANKIVDTRAGGDGASKLENRLHHMTALINDRKATNRAYIVVAHLNKEGDVSGLEEILHDVDTIMLIERMGRLRQLHCPDKNRYGPDDVSAFFRMTPDGLHIVQVVQEGEGDDGDDMQVTKIPMKGLRIELPGGPTAAAKGRAPKAKVSVRATVARR